MTQFEKKSCKKRGILFYFSYRWGIIADMYKTIFKIICCMVLCWVVCVPSFCQAVESMTPNESLEARQKMIAYSKQFVGVPYVYGGASKSGMDCSGLIFTIANDAIGVKLPRSTSGLYSTVRIIKDSEKEPGDLVFFKTVGSRISHVGLYMGNNQFIHAASDGPNTGVIISSLKESYWSSTYAGAGRFLPSIGEERIALVTEDSSSSTGTKFVHDASIIGNTLYLTRYVYSASDIRLKQNVTDLPDLSQIYMQLEPEKFKYSDVLKGYSKDWKFGLIAQDMERLFYEANIPIEETGLITLEQSDSVFNADKLVGDDVVHRINYDQFHAMHIQMIQKQQKEIEELKQEIEKLKELINR